MGITKVVNIKRDLYDVLIDRRSEFGNPFRIGIDGTREECVEKYRELKKNDPEFIRSIQPLRGQKLGCWCKPLACHGDIIVELLDGADKV